MKALTAQRFISVQSDCQMNHADDEMGVHSDSLTF